MRWTPIPAAIPIWLAVQGNAAAQVFVVDPTALPSGLGINSSTMAVALGDVDLDGDWDTALADGGEDVVADQSRLWINLGGLQSGEPGKFADETASRLPYMPASSFDVDLVDIDGDGDPDIHLTNSAEYYCQGSFWWVNLGGVQGGNLGFYVNETNQRWIGVGQPGSSVAPSIVSCGSTSFQDYSEESAFGDLDNDGDLDLIHTSRGLWTDGGEVDVPARIFLNDGQGYFQEFNPSGFMPANGKLEAGDPGVWCDGTYASATTDTSGTYCDITGRTYDVELGDVDGDFDLDIVLGNVTGWPRLYANRLDVSVLAPGSGGTLGFRDVTSLALPTGMLMASYGELLANTDAEPDLELVAFPHDPLPPASAVNLLLHSTGGIFGTPCYVPTPADGKFAHMEANPVDYDNDGDLDLFFSDYVTLYPERLYRNDGDSVFTEVSVPWMFSSECWDAAAADFDGDGDYDIHIATASYSAEVLLENVTGVRDLHGPALPKIEALPDSTAQPGILPVRAYVYDNSPAHVTATNATRLEVSVNGVSLPPFACKSSLAQIFRGEVPANLVGTISYRFTSEDAYGNAGASATKSYLSTAAATHASAYGAGTAGTLSGSEPTLAALSVPFAGSKLYLAGHAGGPTGVLGILVVAVGKLDPPLPIPGLVLANVMGPFALVKVVTTDTSGDAIVPLVVPTSASGIEAYAQFCVLDSTPAGDLLSASKGLALTVQ